MRSADKATIARRDVLKSLGLGAGAATVAAGGAVVGAAPATASEKAADRKKKRYKETEHVKAYYRTNRY